MFAKSSIIFAVLAISAKLAVATPPACLLAAVNVQSDPADLKAVCGNATSVESTISNICGSNVQPAMSAFSSVCKSAGMTVPPISTAPTASISTTASDSISATSTDSSSASATISSSATATHSGSASATASSGSSLSSVTIPLATGGMLVGTAVPTTIVYTSTYFDVSCSCTKTAAMSSTGMAGPTGMATASGVMNGTLAGGTGTATATQQPVFTGAANKNVELGLFVAAAAAVGLLAVA
ncbi:hypothetical protein BJ546DRAFT_971143 [Cryomyces antarcticus]